MKLSTIVAVIVPIGILIMVGISLLVLDQSRYSGQTVITKDQWTELARYHMDRIDVIEVLPDGNLLVIYDFISVQDYPFLEKEEK